MDQFTLNSALITAKNFTKLEKQEINLKFKINSESPNASLEQIMKSPHKLSMILSSIYKNS